MRSHYIVICAGTTGDIHPFMCIAKTLQAMGRRVTFITNTYHARVLSGSGLDFLGVGSIEEYVSLMENPDIWHPRKGLAAILSNYKEHMLQVDAAIRSVGGTSPVTVIAHPFAVPGAALAKERGFVNKIVAMYLAPSALRTCYDPLRVGNTTVPRWIPLAWRRALWRIVERTWIDPLGLPQINGARQALNLPGIPASFLSYLESVPDLTATLFPAWFGPAMPDWPQGLVEGDFQLFDAVASDHFSPELSAFLAAGDPPLVFLPGTGNIQAGAFFTAALAASTRLGRRAIFLTKERGQVPASLPASALWQAYVPLSGLLPQVKALIHHGGVGTIAEALRAGTPQLVAPFAWDQFDNGARVAELGVGLAVPVKKLSAHKMASAIQAIISSERIRANCAQVAGRFAQRQDPRVLCEQIERRLGNAGDASGQHSRISDVCRA